MDALPLHCFEVFPLLLTILNLILSISDDFIQGSNVLNICESLVALSGYFGGENYDYNISPKIVLTLPVKFQSPVAPSKLHSKYKMIKFCTVYFYTIMHQTRGWPDKKSKLQFFQNHPSVYTHVK